MLFWKQFGVIASDSSKLTTFRLLHSKLQLLSGTLTEHHFVALYYIEFVHFQSIGTTYFILVPTFGRIIAEKENTHLEKMA